jgi:hypothetical protein
MSDPKPLLVNLITD